MKNITIIGSRISGKKNNPVTMATHLTSDRVACSVIYWEDIWFDIRTGDVKVFQGEREVFLSRETDLVIAIGWYKSGDKTIYRDVAYSLALVLESRSISYWNGEMGRQRSTSKLSTMVQLALSEIPVPRSLFSLSKINLTERLAYPYVAKAVAASRGQSNFLISSERDTDQFMTDASAFMVQPFLPNEFDLRVICADGVPTLVLRRSRGDAATHLNNTSQGGVPEWLEVETLDDDVLTLVKKICKIMKREMAGVDLIPDESSPVGFRCLEVNAVPQLTSGHDVERKLTALRDVIGNLQRS